MIGAPEPSISRLVAQAGSASLDARVMDFVLWIAVMIVAVVLLGVALMQLRKKLVGARHADQVSAGLVEELRSMKARGEVSEDEFNRARQAWLSSVQSKGPRGDAPRSRIANAPPTPGAVKKPPAHKSQRRPDADDQAGTRRAKEGFDLTGAPLPPRKSE